MNDTAFFLLMLAGMLGYLALLGRVLARRRGDKDMARQSAPTRPRSALPLHRQR